MRREPNPAGLEPGGRQLWERHGALRLLTVGVTQANSIMAIVKTTASGGEIPEKKSESTKAPVKAAPRAAMARSAVKPGDSKTFVQDTVAELKRVVWPTRETVRSGVLVTIGLLIFFSIYIFGLDQLFTVIFKALSLEPK